MSSSLTALAASESRNSSPRKYSCVVRGWYPSAVTLTWMWAGRQAWRPRALSSRPVGPWSGIGYGAALSAKLG